MRERGVTVCFTGHRFVNKEEAARLTARLDNVIDRCVARGKTNFICGGALGFDTLAARRVIAAKERHSSVTLTLVLPCRDQTSRWKNLEDINTYRDIKGAADEIEYIGIFYSPSCMMERNRRMVDLSSGCIAYYNGKPGGAASTISYANTVGVPVVNLFAGAKKEKREE